MARHHTYRWIALLALLLCAILVSPNAAHAGGDENPATQSSAEDASTKEAWAFKPSHIKLPLSFTVGRILGERSKLVGITRFIERDGLLVHSDDQLLCFDGANLNPLWKKPPTCPYQPDLIGVFDDTAALIDPFSVFAVTLKDGEIRWRFPQERDDGFRDGDLVDTLRIRKTCRIGDTLIVATDDEVRRIHAIDLSNGQPQWQQTRHIDWFDGKNENFIVATRKTADAMSLTVLDPTHGNLRKQIDLPIAIPAGLEENCFEFCGDVLIVRDNRQWLGLSLPNLNRRWSIAIDEPLRPTNVRAEGDDLFVIEHLDVLGPLSAVQAFGGGVRYAGFDLKSGTLKWERFYPEAVQHAIQQVDETGVWSSHPKGVICHRDGRLQFSIQHDERAYSGAYQRELAWHRHGQRLLRMIEVTIGDGGSRRYRPVLIDYDLKNQRLATVQAFDNATSPFPVDAAIVSDGVVILQNSELRRYTSE